MKKTVGILLLAVVCLMALGFVMLTSLHVAFSGVPQRNLLPAHLITWQILGAGVGLALMFEVSRVDYRRWRKIATPFAGMVFLLLVLALIPGMGPTYKGLRRWVYLGHWGSFQPSILAGIALVLFLAWWYESKPVRSGYLFWVPFVFVGSLASLISVEMDVTTALLMAMTGGVVMILGGEKLYYLIYCVFLTASGLAWMILRDPMRMARMDANWLGMSPEQVHPPLYALALRSGGWNGVGLGHGQWVGCFLPEAGTEFMSAVIGEELGLGGLLAGLVLYAVIAGCGLRIGAKAPDRFGALLAYGIVVWMMMPVLLTLLFLATLLNIHFPLLPFVSGGGLYICTSLIGVGVLVNVANANGGIRHETGLPADAGDAAAPDAP